jgi:hypothetical protein
MTDSKESGKIDIVFFFQFFTFFLSLALALSIHNKLKEDTNRAAFGHP